MLSAEPLLPNLVGQFMSSPGPSAYTTSMGRLCANLPRVALGGEDRFFWILRLPTPTLTPL